MAVSDAEHYAYRECALRDFNAVEFGMCFDVVKMDREERTARVAAENALEDGGFVAAPAPRSHAAAGRPINRFYYFDARHPLWDSHKLVMGQKVGLPAYAGQPPPVCPRVLGGSGRQTRAQRLAERDFVRYYCANFIPWSYREDERPILSCRAGRRGCASCAHRRGSLTSCSMRSSST